MIYPDCDMRKWEYCDTQVILANSEYYYTKEQTEELIDEVSGMTPSEVQSMIDSSIRTKADKSEVAEIAEVVRQQGERLLNTYTKTETNALLNSYLTKLEANQIASKYAEVSGDVLVLNSENIT